MNWKELLEHIDRRFQESQEARDRATSQIHEDHKALAEKIYELSHQVSQIEKNQEQFNRLYERQIKTEEDISEINQKLNTQLGKNQIIIGILATISTLVLTVGINYYGSFLPEQDEPHPRMDLGEEK